MTSKPLAIAGLALAALALAPGAALAAPFGFPDQVTVMGEQVNGLYQLMTWISLGILAVVWIGLAAALIKFRKRPGETRQPATWSHNTKLEVIWTVIPFILLIIILVPTFRAIAYVADVPKNGDLTLEVVGRQFFWEYRYPELGVKFTTTPTLGPGTGTEELYIPVNRKIKVVLTSADVIHAWWVPQFGYQQMTTPGNLAMVPLEVTKTGLYEGACTFLCGSLHGAMRVLVRAVEPAEFDTWVAKHRTTEAIEPIARVGKVGMVAPPPKKPDHDAPHGEAPHGDAPKGAAPHGETPAAGEPHTAAPAGDTAAPAVDAAALAAEGKTLYTSRCAGCHGAEGAGVAGVFPPLAGAEQVTGEADELVKIVLNGLNGPITVKGKQYSGAMPPFRDSLSDQEVAAVTTYLRTSFGNSAGPVTPEQVKALR